MDNFDSLSATYNIVYRVSNKHQNTLFNYRKFEQSIGNAIYNIVILLLFNLAVMQLGKFRATLVNFRMFQREAIYLLLRASLSRRAEVPRLRLCRDEPKLLAKSNDFANSTFGGCLNSARARNITEILYIFTLKSQRVTERERERKTEDD